MNTTLQKYARLKTEQLGTSEQNLLTPPQHILDPSFFGLSSTKSSSSLSIIFSIWNTMCGSTLLACPWGFHESGLIPAILSIIIVGLCSYYTCTLIIKHTTMKGEDDFGDICVKILGKWSQYLALAVSCIILVGASIAYHMFMRDCLLSIVDGLFSVNTSSGIWYWNEYWASIAIFIILFPLVNLKRLTILVKFNSFGVFFVCFLILYIIYSCSTRIIDTLKNLPPGPFDPWKPLGIPLFGKNSAHLLGILSLSFFIHNAISSILKNQKSTKSFRRTGCEVFVAFFMAAATYGIPGVMGLIAFRYESDVSQNFLNQFPNTDILATVARFAVMFQLLSIFPLLIYIIRVQVFGFFLKKQYPGFFYILALSTTCCTITTCFSMFFPHVGTVLQYCGAICGLVYLYILPILLHLRISYLNSKLKWYSVILHGLLLLFGVLILVSQFIPFEMIF